MSKRKLDNEELVEPRGECSDTSQAKCMGSSQKEGSFTPQAECTGWSTLPKDLLLNIFSRLDRKELLWVISLVCRLWALVCWEMLFWTSDGLNFYDLKRLCDTDGVEPVHDQMGKAVMRVLKNIFNRDGALYKDIKRICHVICFPCDYVSDRHLIYAAERTPKIWTVFLSNMDMITGEGFSRAIRHWKQLTTISMAPPDPLHYPCIIKEIGINCRHLMFVALQSANNGQTRFILNEFSSLLIADNLCNLEILHMRDCSIYKLGLKTLMTKCKKLWCVDLLRCHRALDARFPSDPLYLIPEWITLEISKEDDGAWSMGELLGRHDMASAIDLMWAPEEAEEARRSRVN